VYITCGLLAVLAMCFAIKNELEGHQW